MGLRARLQVLLPSLRRRAVVGTEVPAQEPVVAGVTGFPGYVQRWLNDPDGGAGAFKGTGDEVRKHDPTCKSLQGVWMPRKGGRSCPSDWTWCQGCDVSFLNEDIRYLFEECQNSNHYYCECCSRTATHPVGDCTDD